MGALGLYLAVMYVDSDERLTSGGRGNVRLGVLMQASAEAAKIAALEKAREFFPPADGYTGHGAYIETAPLDWLRLVLPFATEVEPYVPMRKRPRAPDEEWPDLIAEADTVERPGAAPQE